MFFNPSAMTALPLHIAIRTEMAMAGLDYYKSKPIKNSHGWLGSHVTSRRSAA